MDGSRVVLCIASGAVEKLAKQWLAGEKFHVTVAGDATNALQLLMGGWNRGTLYEAIVTDSAALARMVRDAPAPVRATPIVFRGAAVEEVRGIVNTALPDTADLIDVAEALREAILEFRRHPPPDSESGTTLRRT
jgi:hypothetical protein